MTSVSTISVTDLAGKAKSQSVVLIDVRTPVEFREVHAQMAKNVPLDSLKPSEVMGEHDVSDADPLYVICRSGSRSAKACEAFHAAGYKNVVSVDGGTQAWSSAGLPVNRGKKAISLERQVRIAAGSIALVGSLAAIFTNNVYFAGIPAFIGAGLTFAGITDTCGMGMMLAKMPWNQCNTETCRV